jgi:hypothetical protein
LLAILHAALDLPQRQVSDAYGRALLKHRAPDRPLRLANPTFFSVEFLHKAADYLNFAAAMDGGEPLEPEVAARLMTLPATPWMEELEPRWERWSRVREEALGVHLAGHRTAIERQISERSARFFDAEAQNFDDRADDLKVGRAREIKELDRQIDPRLRQSGIRPRSTRRQLRWTRRIKPLSE